MRCCALADDAHLQGKRQQSIEPWQWARRVSPAGAAGLGGRCPTITGEMWLSAWGVGEKVVYAEVRQSGRYRQE